MIQRKEDKNISGIYCIKNTVNGKVYIGKAKCIHKRIKAHVTYLNTKNKNENRLLINSWHFHGRDNFDYSVIEIVPDDENLESELKRLELKYILEYKSLDREFGYNLRLDSETKMVTSYETRKLLSDAIRRRTPELNAKVGKKVSEFWSNENNTEAKNDMRDNVSKSNCEHDYYQYDKKSNDLIRIWGSIHEILKENPEYKRHNIYSACSGAKPSIYGYKWKKKLKEKI